MKLILALSLTLLPFWGSSNQGDEEPVSRPLDHWVQRAHLDGQAGTIVAILHPYLTASYDPRRAGLFKVWRGSLEKHGPGYDGDMKGYSSPQGYPFEEHPVDEPGWRVLRKGKDQLAQARIASYRIKDQKLYIKYILTLQDGQELIIEEYPEYQAVKREDNRSGFVRTFMVIAGPPDVDVMVHLEVADLIGKNDLKTSTKFSNVTRLKRMFEWGNTYRFEGDMVLDRDEPTVLEMVYTINAETEARRRNGNSGG
ncbi:MAG: hypothetical protein AAFV07_00660 [Bacteroidota bacterium]